MPVLTCKDVGVEYVREIRKKEISKNSWMKFSKRRKEKFWALKDINFEVEDGHVLGVIGKNGAGKSTLLRVLTGVLPPDRGSVSHEGKISALLGLGTGFLSDLTGRDNLFLSAMYLGMTEEEIRSKYDDIVEFSEIGDFIDTPIRHYSSGMKARLGFSLAVFREPDILIVEEVLATGDMSFQNKAREKMEQLMLKAKAIVICSHSTKFMQDFCDEVIWLEGGEIKEFGKSDKVVKAYRKSVTQTTKQQRRKESKERRMRKELRHEERKKLKLDVEDEAHEEPRQKDEVQVPKE